MENAMKISEVESSFANGSEYKGVDVQLGKERWGIMLVTGKINYVSIAKTYPNPHCTLGKRFADFDEAQEAYRSNAIKVMISMASLKLK